MTFFIWEGVTMYIPEEAIRSTLHFVATESAPGSSIVLDGKQRSFIDWLRRTLLLPKRFRKLCAPLWQLKRGLFIGGNLGYLGFPTDENGSFSRASGSTLSNYFRRMGPRQDGAILHGVMGALPFP